MKVHAANDGRAGMFALDCLRWIDVDVAAISLLPE